MKKEKWSNTHFEHPEGFEVKKLSEMNVTGG
jgi:hypothetical protein